MGIEAETTLRGWSRNAPRVVPSPIGPGRPGTAEHQVGIRDPNTGEGRAELVLGRPGTAEHQLGIRDPNTGKGRAELVLGGPRRDTSPAPSHPAWNGQAVLARLLAVSCALPALLLLGLFCCSCRRPETTALPVRRCTIWNVPADGTRIPAPRGLALGRAGELYAVDNAARILVFSPEGKLIRQWRMPDSQVGTPEDLTVLRDGCIAVPDTHYHRVVIFTPTGETKRVFGTFGRAPGQFLYPVSLVEDEDGALFICEYGSNDRVQKFTAEGVFVSAFGQFGTGPGQFQRPSGMVLHAGRLYISDAANHRVQVFSDAGKFLGVLGGGAAPAMSFPYDLALGPRDALHIVEWGAGRLTVLDLQGDMVGRHGTPGFEITQMATPWGVVCGPDGTVFVADTGNRRIIRIEL